MNLFAKTYSTSIGQKGSPSPGSAHASLSRYTGTPGRGSWVVRPSRRPSPLPSPRVLGEGVGLAQLLPSLHDESIGGSPSDSGVSRSVKIRYTTQISAI